MLHENIDAITSRIHAAAARASRRPDDIRLVAVSKTAPAAAVRDALTEGLRIFGENRVQEARDKIAELNALMPDAAAEWHLIGHLQKNKAKNAVELFDWIHSVDSIELADELNRQAEKRDRTIKVLIEVKLSHEESKHGIDAAQTEALAAHMQRLDRLELKGLMTIPPFFDDPEEARPYFRRLRELRDALRGKGYDMPELSMGMSNDFEVAIEEGATFVRVGTAIFGGRI